MNTEDKINKIKEIGEELRITRYKDTGKMAFDYIYNKYKNIFDNNYDKYLKCMEICAVFFASRMEDTIKDRENTVYKYI